MAETEESLDQLAGKAREGCLLSYEKIVTLLQNRIFTFVLQMVRNEEDAEDIAQETFIKAYRNLKSFDGRARFTTWIYTIARNTAVNNLRRRKPHESIDFLHETLPQPAPAETDSRCESIWRLARELKPNYHQLLWLHYADGFSMDEIARITQTNSVAVRVGLHRARAALKKKCQLRMKDGPPIASSFPKP